MLSKGVNSCKTIPMQLDEKLMNAYNRMTALNGIAN